MTFFSRSMYVARKLSVFYLFILVFGLFFGVYRYKFIPDSQQEISERGFRILNKLVYNTINRYNDLDSAFSNYFSIQNLCNLNSSAESKDSQGTLRGQLENSIHFESINKLLINNKDKKAFNYFIFLKDNEYKIQFNSGIQKDSSQQLTIVGVQDFMTPLLDSRQDLFDSYMLLYQEPPPVTPSRPMGDLTDSSLKVPWYHIIYQQQNLTPSGIINLDSAIKLSKNTDQSEITEMTINGKLYELFLQPFIFHGDRLMLTGMMSKDEYGKLYKAMPVGFASNLVIIILCTLILLPFLKVFFLSSGENIDSKDVLSLSLSAFMGTSIILLIAVYLYMGFAMQHVFEERLKTISQQLKSEINHNLESANTQMAYYDQMYRDCIWKYRDSLQDEIGELKTSRPIGQNQSIEQLDNLFNPGFYKNLNRVFWVDSQGTTIAKWNPFRYYAPLTNVRGYTYFDSLPANDPLVNRWVRDSVYQVYPTKSNVTNEFQIYLSRPSRDSFGLNTDTCRFAMTNLKSSAIIESIFLDCSIKPVLPPGFGYSIIDNASKEVLINSDNRKNLSENLMEETQNDPRLKYRIDYKNEEILDNAPMYGDPYVFQVRPLTASNLSLVVFYNKNIVLGNLFRMFHFSAESIIYLFVALAICILLSQSPNVYPPKLRINLQKVEWFRPSNKNYLSYHFTKNYWTAILILTLVLFLIILIFVQDFQVIFYCSLMLPFYTLWGFVASRKMENSELIKPWKMTGIPVIDKFQISSLNRFGGPDKDKPWKKPGIFLTDMVRLSWITSVFIILINYLLLRFINKDPSFRSTRISFLLLAYQASVIWFFYVQYKRCFGRKLESSQGDDSNFSKNYLTSVYLGILLISILPLIGIMLFGFQSEKFQYIKDKQLSLASSYEQRVKYFSNELIPGYKDIIQQNDDYIKNLKYSNGFYLADSNDQILPVTEKTYADSSKEMAYYPDSLYSKLMNDVFLVTAREFDKYSIGNSASDGSWYFYEGDNKNLPHVDLLYTPKPSDPDLHFIKVASVINSPWADFWGFHSWFQMILLVFLSISFIYFGMKLLKAAANRIFLLNYFTDRVTVKSKIEFLPAHFSSLVSEGYFLENGQNIPVEAYFRREWDKSPLSQSEQEEEILLAGQKFLPAFGQIWNALSPKEKYILYDFSLDEYTNYKEVDSIKLLIEKGLLTYEFCRLRLFSASFQNFLLSKKDSKEIIKLKSKYSTPGAWETIRVPVLVFVAVTALLIFTTQADLSNRISGLLASLTAIVPLLLKLTNKLSSP